MQGLPCILISTLGLFQCVWLLVSYLKIVQVYQTQGKFQVKIQGKQEKGTPRTQGIKPRTQETPQADHLLEAAQEPTTKCEEMTTKCEEPPADPTETRYSTLSKDWKGPALTSDQNPKAYDIVRRRLTKVRRQRHWAKKERPADSERR